ncbi:hypothetical protein BC835DRAFT_1207440, partial [Cytidiella melzeri]
ELPVTFVPALYLQRRGWVFDIMRRERVTQVLDVGCGEGETVACLCNAAPWLPLQSTHFPLLESTLELDIASLSQENDIRDQDDFLHIRTLHALDVSQEDLQQVLSFAKPEPPPSTPQLWPGPTRWEPLHVKVWHGGMETYNPEFVGIECIISTEVVEHLSEDVLPIFAPMLLGMYHPRLLLITTPSYTYNSRFTAPDAPPDVRQGTPDPTGRTDRIFRHWDHKFEWTVDEFTSWCQEAAKQWGYEVEVSGIGVATEKDPFGRDKDLGKASQVAAFRRREDPGMAELREWRCAETCMLGKTRAGQPHRLFGSYQHEAHSGARKAGTLENIGQLILQRMETYQEPHMTVQELWSEHDISLLCGGWLQKLIAAVKATDSLTLQKADKRALSDWIVQVKG